MKKLKLFNTLTNEKEEFKPIDPKKVKYYSCGPTVYNYPHIGNFTYFIRVDLLKRVLCYLGYNVEHVMNITDIDDKIINKLKEEKTDLKTFTNKYTNYFIEKLNELNIISPKIVKVTESIDQIIDLIKILIDKEYAYETEDGVYFNISKFKDYGKLSKINLDKLKKNARINNDEYDKEHFGDFALWKKATDEEINLGVYWDSPWGKGRPGWHIECSAIAINNLGETIDIHSGGIDLIFPHHENEIAQSESATGKTFCHYWYHTGHVLINGVKISKSLGNVISLEEIKEIIDDLSVFRYWVLTTHYRSQANFSKESLISAGKTLMNLLITIDKLINQDKINNKKKKVTIEINETKEKIINCLLDDLNTPSAIAELFNFIEQINDKYIENKEEVLSFIFEIDRIFGLNLKKLLDYINSVPEHILAKADLRLKYRENKEYDKADCIREEIKNHGYYIEDIEKGYIIYKNLIKTN